MLQDKESVESMQASEHGFVRSACALQLGLAASCHACMWMQFRPHVHGERWDGFWFDNEWGAVALAFTREHGPQSNTGTDAVLVSAPSYLDVKE